MLMTEVEGRSIVCHGGLHISTHRVGCKLKCLQGARDLMLWGQQGVVKCGKQKCIPRHRMREARGLAFKRDPENCRAT